MEKRHTLTDNTALRRYEFDLGGDKAVIEYILGPGYRILTHTEVPPKFEGQGIGRELVAAALEDLRDKKLQFRRAVYRPPSPMGKTGVPGDGTQVAPDGQADRSPDSRPARYLRSSGIGSRE